MSARNGTSAWLGAPFARASVLALAFVASSAAWSGVDAQLLRGLLIDDETGQPIPTASITLLNARDEVVNRVVTDSAGRFVFRPQMRGEFHLRGEMLGYMTTSTPGVNVGPVDTLDLEFRMRPDAVLLGPLTVVASARPYYELLKPPALWQFYERKTYMERLGLGRFLTRENIDDWLGPVSSLIATMPGVQVTYGEGGGAQVSLRRTAGLADVAGGAQCNPLVFLNGGRINLAGMSIDELIDVQNLEGIEVYRGPSEIPAELTSSDSQCGAIALWTRRGG